MKPPVSARRSQRLAAWTAIAGTVFVATLAFSLSFRSLEDLARRSGIVAGQAWMWPLIVDGIIVVATVSVVALAGHKANWYPWSLLAAGATVSVTANAAHALVAADADVPRALAACVAAVPPLVLLAVTHLTVVLTRQGRVESTDSIVVRPKDIGQGGPANEVLRPVAGPREAALRMRAEGLSNRAIAKATGVHPSTVGRWFAARQEAGSSDAADRRVIDEFGSAHSPPVR